MEERCRRKATLITTNQWHVLLGHKDPTEALHLTVCGTVGRTKAGSPSYLLPAAEEQLWLLLRHRLECLG